MDPEDFFSLADLKPASVKEDENLEIKTPEEAGKHEDSEGSLKGKDESPAEKQDEVQKAEAPELKAENPEEDRLLLKTETKTGDAPLPEGQDDSSFSVFAKYLKEEGVLSDMIDSETLEGVKSIEDLKNIVKTQIEKSRYSDLTETQRRYLESVESGIPLSDLQEIEQNLGSLKTIDKEVLAQDVQLRFDLIVTDLIESGFEEERATAMAQRVVDSKEDEAEAETAIANMIKRREEDYKALLKEGKEKKISTLKEVEEFVNSKKEKVLESIELDDAQRKEVYNLMVNQVDTTENGAPVNAFAKWRKEKGLEAEFILNALYLHTNGFKNLGSIENQVASSSAKRLEELLKGNESKEITDALSSGASKGKLTLL
jgi:hypothetical protein